MRLKSFGSVALGAFLFFFCAEKIARATTEVFVYTDDGIWVASDTLRTKIMHGTRTPETVCKLVFSPGRIMFNPGKLTDPVSLENAESHLGLAPMQSIEPALFRLLHSDWGGKEDESVGVVQFQNGKPEAFMFELSAQGWLERPVLESNKNGFLHGFGGQAFQQRVKESMNPDQAAAIAKDPQIELEKVLQAEVDTRPGEVGRPFSVFLLRNDGTIVDYSTTHVCEVPSSVPHTVATP